MRKDPSRYQEILNEIMKKDPYLGLFGYSEALGVWNPWGRSWSILRNQHIYSKLWTDCEEYKRPSERKTRSYQKEARPQKDSDKVKPLNEIKASERSVSKVAEPPADYTIDLIAMRKVARKAPVSSTGSSQPIHALHASSGAPKVSSDTNQIPVKRYVAKVSMTDLGKDEIKALTSKNRSRPSPLGFATQPWLVREGFIGEIKAKASLANGPNRESSEKATQPTTTGPTRIESAIDRLTASSDPARKLQYRAEENRTEDVDLLRASDVRATSGHLTAPSLSSLKGNEADRERHRIRLEKHFGLAQTRVDQELTAAKPFVHKFRTSRSNDSRGQQGSINFATKMQGQLAQGNGYEQNLPHELIGSLATGTAQEQSSSDSSVTQTPKPGCNSNQVISLHSHDAAGSVKARELAEVHDLKEFTNKIQSAERQYAEQEQNLLAAEKEIKDLKWKAADVLLRQEVGRQKAAMEAHENRPRKVETLRNIGAPSSGFEGTCLPTEADVARRRVEEAHNAQRERDQDFVKEIRDIYESTYGKITTEHRQLVESNDSVKGNEPLVENLNNEKTNLKSDMPLPVKQPTKTSVKEPARPPIEATSVKKNRSTNLVISKAQNGPENYQKWALRTYKILTLDDTKEKVLVARTTSSIYESISSLRSPSYILSRLDNPVKYFESMESLEKEGFELVAGNRKMLIYKKVALEQYNALLAVEASEPAIKAEAVLDTKAPRNSGASSQEVPSSTDCPSVARTTSTPKDDPSQTAIPQSTDPSTPPPPAPRLVKRQEPVFSGTPTHTQRMLAARNREVERLARRRAAHTTPPPPSSGEPAVGGNGRHGVGRFIGPGKRFVRGVLTTIKVVAATAVVVYFIGWISEVTTQRLKEHDQKKRQEEGEREVWGREQRGGTSGTGERERIKKLVLEVSLIGIALALIAGFFFYP